MWNSLLSVTLYSCIWLIHSFIHLAVFDPLSPSDPTSSERLLATSGPYCLLICTKEILTLGRLRLLHALYQGVWKAHSFP